MVSAVPPLVVVTIGASPADDVATADGGVGHFSEALVLPRLRHQLPNPTLVAGSVD